MSLGSNGMDWRVRCEKFERDFILQTCALSAPGRPVLHPSLCSNETVSNTPKHELGIQWCGSGAFVAKNFEATSLNELVH
jgi:hypothetical protein